MKPGAMVEGVLARIKEAKVKYLGLASADKKGGATKTGVKLWVAFAVNVAGVEPFPDPRVETAGTAAFYEDLLEDCAVWIVSERPFGNFVNDETAGKYISEARAFYDRWFRAVLGVGAARSRIKQVLKGYARTVVRPPKAERVGCTPADLAEGMRRRQSTPMLRAAMTVCMSGLMRGCEVALGEKEQFEEDQHSTVDDVTVFEWKGRPRAKIRMRKRKDLRVLRGKHDVVYLSGGAGGHIDAVAELREWIRARRAAGIADNRPLFCWPDGSMLTVDELRDEVKACMQAVGLDPANFGAHSCRIGGATAALAAGVSPQLIRLMGRWSSDIYEIYCRMSLEAAMGVGDSIASATVTPTSDAFATEALELLPDEMAGANALAMAMD